MLWTAASDFNAVWVCSAQEQVTSGWASSEQRVCGLHRSTWFEDEPLLSGAPNQTQGGCCECKRWNIKMLRHFKYKIAIFFNIFFRGIQKISRWPPLFVAGKDDNTKTTGLSTTRGLSFIFTRSGMFNWKNFQRHCLSIRWSTEYFVHKTLLSWWKNENWLFVSVCMLYITQAVDKSSRKISHYFQRPEREQSAIWQ